MPTRKAAQGSGSLRGFIGEVMEEEATLEQVREVLQTALGATATSLVECPGCGKSFKAKLPDVKRQLDSIIAALEQVEGRPEQRAPEATSITLKRVSIREVEKAAPVMPDV